MVPFTLFLGCGFPYQVTNQKKGAPIIIWLLELLRTAGVGPGGPESPSAPVKAIPWRFEKEGIQEERGLKWIHHLGVIKFRSPGELPAQVCIGMFPPYAKSP